MMGDIDWLLKELSPDPVESIYSGIVSIRSLRLVIFLAKSNDMDVWGADIHNAWYIP